MARIVLIPTANGDKTRPSRSACEAFAATFRASEQAGNRQEKTIVAIFGCYCESFSLRYFA